MVTVTPAEATAAEVSVNVPCGQTVVVAIPAAKNVIGAAVKIHESTPPAGGVAAADVTAVLTTADQTLTINNSAAVVAVLAQTGGAGQADRPTGKARSRFWGRLLARLTAEQRKRLRTTR
jgi:hypothetical protein